MSRDPLEQIFQSLDPTRQLSDEQLDSIFPVEMLIDRLSVSQHLSRFGSLKRRLFRRSVVVTTISVLVVAGVATAVTLARAPVRSVAHMTCFQGVSLKSSADVVPYGSDPLAICAQVMHWSNPAGSSRKHGLLCTLSDGSVAAFPPAASSDSCARLGLVAFNGQLASPRFAKFQLAAEAYFTTHDCVSPASARRNVLVLLGKYGVVEWRVQTVGSRSPKSCATLSFEVGQRLVSIVGVMRSARQG